MRAIELLIAAVLVLAAMVLFKYGYGLNVSSSIHQIYQMMYYICAILCFGFGVLMLKSNRKSINEVKCN